MTINEINAAMPTTMPKQTEEQSVIGATMYKGHGAWQCWKCERRAGEDIGVMAGYEGIVKFPVCSVSGEAMYEVYETPCSHYEPKLYESKIEPLPCPFCGKTASVKVRYRKGTANRLMYWVECGHCMVSQAHDNGHGFNRKEKAIEAWNRRRGDC